ncbi:hypothetical protein QC761_0093530 [Podospora bellae-mahoneyi]|uniref:Uncharacterized protein n=1 Tax=Podospora bellae-mahoneyi TaxID=2093777 RepID=A0ABR0F9C3_9PEZI|nr:hypothetical protein QC761_0093530 [Podospora bellae-mahoneyi]
MQGTPPTPEGMDAICGLTPLVERREWKPCEVSSQSHSESCGRKKGQYVRAELNKPMRCQEVC